MGRNLFELSVPCDKSAPHLVRSAISRSGVIRGRALEDAKLVLSELVTNAVVHSDCADDEFLSVRVSRNSWLRISVIDPGRSGGSVEVRDRGRRFGGLGLKVVAKLAKHWGAERRSDGYAVWADLELAS
jgi:anti-sigma regulatory factor (Ser/Thr protein kinase)